MPLENNFSADSRRFQDLIEGSVQGVHVHQNFRPIYANQALADLFGYQSPAQILALSSILELASPSERTRLTQIAESRMAGGNAPDRHESEGVRRDGSTVWIETTSRRVWWEGVWSIHANVTDITGRKRAEAALRESEEQLRALMDNARAAISLKDATGRLVLVNEKFCEWLAADPAQVVGRTLGDLLSAEVAAQLSDYDQAVTRGEDTPPLTQEITFPDGITRWIQTHKSPIFDEAGNIARILTIGTDVSESKREEARFQQTQKLEALGLLTSGIAHDFNNLLATVIGFSELTAEHPSVVANPSLARYQHEVVTAGYRAGDLVKQMLAYVRPDESPAMVLALQPIVHEALRMLRATLPATINIESQIASDLGLVSLQATQAAQVIMNLCLNASDANQLTGDIEVRVEAAEDTHAVCAGCQQTIEGRYVALSVRDTGPGIDPEVLNRVFDPFFTTKPVGEGSGLGLSVVHGIVHAHGGHVVVESTIGQGTTFCVLFPVVSSTTPTPSLPPRVASMGSSERAAHILVVDDEPSVLLYMEELLRLSGYEVTGYDNSKNALAAIISAPTEFDLIVLDQTMAHMTGLQLVAELDAGGYQLPVILCSGAPLADLDPPPDSPRIHKIFSKPIEAHQLLESIEQLLVRLGPKGRSNAPKPS